MYFCGHMCIHSCLHSHPYPSLSLLPFLSLSPFFPFLCICPLATILKPVSSHRYFQLQFNTLHICNSLVQQCETSLQLSTIYLLICSVLECAKIFQNFNPCLCKKRSLQIKNFNIFRVLFIFSLRSYCPNAMFRSSLG